MAIDNEIARGVPTNNDLALAIVTARVTNLSIMKALRALDAKDQVGFDEAMKNADAADDKMDELFNRLTGWTPNAK